MEWLKQIYSDKTLISIPKSTVHHWRSKKLQFYGSNYENLDNCIINELKIILDHRLKKRRQLFVSYCRLYLMMRNLFG